MGGAGGDMVYFNAYADRNLSFCSARYPLLGGQKRHGISILPLGFLIRHPNHSARCFFGLHIPWSWTNFSLHLCPC